MGLRKYITSLESSEELIRIKNYTDPELIISEITDRMSKQEGGGKALLFENTGTDFPVLTNMMGSNERMCKVLGVKHLDEVGERIGGLLSSFQEKPAGIYDKLKMLGKLAEVSVWMPKTVSGKGSCQEVIMLNPDINLLPVLKCWPADGGRFVTFPLVITREPHTGIRNVGMYRMQVYNGQTTGMHWHRHKTGAKHYQLYKELGKRMPVSVVLGGDPVYTYAATAPLPENIDEFMFAGFLRNKGVRMVKCLTNDLEVPEDADFVIEGYVDPSEDLKWEGPFGDHTGFYSLADYYPVFHITCITHCRGAVYPATLVGVPPQEDAWIAKATERIFLFPMKIGIAPEIKDIDLPTEGTAHNLAIVSIHKTYPGQAFKIMSALWGAGQMMFNKVLIICDQNINVNDYALIAKLLRNFKPAQHVLTSRGPLDVLDHASSVFSVGGKLGLDLTSFLPEEKDENPFNAYLYDKQIVANLYDIKGILVLNEHLLQTDIPVVIASVKEMQASERQIVAQTIADTIPAIKICALLDERVDVSDLQTTIWLILANIDTARDVKILSNKQDDLLYIDATRKHTGKDGFKRLWPNVVCADEETILSVDKMWEDLPVEDFIKSPSLHYQSLNDGNGAVAGK
jgi:4-hydroxy-3-polyprenylbenzoate decarboxylase